MNAADIAAALGDARREGRAWRCRCPLHGGRSLVVSDGDGGRLLVQCWGGCDRFDVLAELRRSGLLDAYPAYRLPRTTRLRRENDGHADDARRIARARRIWREACDLDRSPVA